MKKIPDTTPYAVWAAGDAGEEKTAKVGYLGRKRPKGPKKGRKQGGDKQIVLVIRNWLGLSGRGCARGASRQQTKKRKEDKYICGGAHDCNSKHKWKVLGKEK